MRKGSTEGQGKKAQHTLGDASHVKYGFATKNVKHVRLLLACQLKQCPLG